ncbi:MAG: hypothetical protein WC314_22300 [Vulcanimicrobiota bacterium]
MALFLFAILVPLFAGIWPIHKRAVSQSQAALSGNHICRQVLEECLTSGYDGVDAMAGTSLEDRTIQLISRREDRDGGTNTQTRTFVWSVEIKTRAEEPVLLPGEKLVIARVDWEDQGETRQYVMNTILAEAP